MRLSKTVWIILGVVVFVIGVVYLYMMYSRQGDEQEQLRARLAVNQATLPKLVAERESLQSQLVRLQEEIAQRQNALNEANLALSANKTGWPAAAESIEYDEKLFELADGWNLDITVVTADEPKDVKISGITFHTTSFTVQVRGKPLEAPYTLADDYRDYIYDTVDDILAFLHALVNDKAFVSTRIELVGLQVPVPLTQEEIDEEAPQTSPTAQISLTIYTYKGG